MSDVYIGEIRMFGFDRAPLGWFLCDGSLQSIAENEVLYSLIGTTYGGDGLTTFGMPDLRGRVPLHQGQGTGLSNYVVGQKAGTEVVVLSAQQMPQHTHALYAATTGTRTATASNNVLASGEADLFNRDADNANAVSLSSAHISYSGNSMPHENMQPSLCVNFCIAAVGAYPSRS